MALSSHSAYERSPPGRVVFAGLEGYTADMETHGWEFYLEQTPGSEHMHGRSQMTMRHRPSGLVMVSHFSIDDYRRAAFEPFRDVPPTFHINRVVHERHAELIRADAVVPNFDRVSMAPSYGEREVALHRFKLADLFTPWAPEAQEIIVEPKTVAALLEQIKSLQQPELVEMRRRAYVRSRPTQDTMVAQIIAFAA